MSFNSIMQSPKSSNCSWVSQSRSISDVIQSLKMSFLDTDFRAAVRELMEREEGLRKEKEEIVASLREKSDILEADLRGLKIQECSWKVERSRLMREFEDNNDKLTELARELSSAKEREEMAIKRCDRMIGELREGEVEKEKLIRNLSDLSDMVYELKRKLREKEELVEVVGKKAAQLKAQSEELEEKLKLDSCLEELKREKEEKIKELLNRNEAEITQLKTQVKVQGEEMEDMQRMNACLEEQKAESDARVKEVTKSNEEKDARIKKLTEEIEVSERKKSKIVKGRDDQIQELRKEREGLGVEKRELAAKLGQVEEKFLKLEGDVITCMCLDLGRDKRFASTHVGKVLSGIIKALNSEEVGLTCNAGMAKGGNPQEADSAFVSRTNEPKCCLKSEKQSIEAVKRTLVFETEFTSEDGAAGNKRTTFADPIIIDSDDDDDDENLLHANSVKNKRHFPGSFSERHNHDGSSDDTLDPLRKTKKLKHVLCKQVKQEPSLPALSTTKIDHFSSVSQTQPSATIKKCDGKLGRGGPICSFLKDVDSKCSYGTPKADNLCSAQVEELMTTRLQRQQNKRLECVADMFCAFGKDDDFCAKAVCSLYRAYRLSGMNGLIFSGSKGFEECDIERVVALAKILIDGDPSSKMKKSVDQLLQDDLDNCRRLALKYSRQLMDIYKKREDPLFSPLSKDLQYK